ncbi:MAG TPA: flagellar hook-basal body complex protein [Bacteroidota bacterium]|nr:flagellar hook-basal body complex protein [Bacteroidota bacterium]
MAFLRSLFAGVSGLQNNQLMMDIIGNNIANINTIGFKGSRATFSEALAQTLQGAGQATDTNGGTNAIQVGLGVSVNTVDTLYTQGNLETTGVSTDLAIQGNGFFAVNQGGTTHYTRVGTFQLDALGQLVNPGTGAILEGKLASANGVIPAGTQLENLKIDLNQTSPAKATTSVKLAGNLNSTATVANADLTGNIDSGTAVGGSVSQQLTVTDDFGTAHTVTVKLTKTAADTWSVATTDSAGAVTGGAGTATFDPATGNLVSFTPANVTLVPTDNAPSISLDLTSTGLTQAASASTLVADLSKAADSTNGSVTVYDSLGNSHTLSVKFTKTSVPNEWTWTATVPGPATITSGQTGKIDFNSDGTLKSFTYDDGSSDVSIDPNDGASAMAIALGAGTVNAFSGITQTSGTSSISPQSQDGYSAGSLNGISVDQTGKIIGTFSNGATVTMGQVMLATFNNPSGLTKVGENMFDSTGNSGTPKIGVPDGSSGSTIVSGSLEQSNVDLAQEFTNMITAQRGFQANARVITVADQFLDEVVSLKR